MNSAQNKAASCRVLRRAELGSAPAERGEELYLLS